MNSETFSLVKERAKKSLRANLLYTPQGPVFVAGANQFKTLWIRDFCLSVPGILRLDSESSQFVRSQLELILSYQRSDGLLPRGIDSINPKIRVVTQTFCPALAKFKYFNYNSKLKPEYRGEHGTLAFDSNILTILACFQYLEYTKDHAWLKTQTDKLKRAFYFYKGFLKDGLFSQPAFSDWQDSLKREGPQAYFHILFLKVLNKIQELNLPSQEGWDLSWIPSEYPKKIKQSFFVPPKMSLSLEAILWAIEEPHFLDTTDKTELYNFLKSASFWKDVGVPGNLQPSSEVSWTTKIVGLRHYHDHFRWSWLMGESLRLAAFMRDPKEVSRILNEIKSVTDSTDFIAEIYELKKPLPVKRLLYSSEAPFSWGAGKILEALSFMETQESSI